MTLIAPEPHLESDVESDVGSVRGAIAPGRAGLCQVLLERNLHQLHRAADDLRVTAMRFRERADELEAAVAAAA